MTLPQSCIAIKIADAPVSPDRIDVAGINQPQQVLTKRSATLIYPVQIGGHFAFTAVEAHKPVVRFNNLKYSGSAIYARVCAAIAARFSAQENL